MNGAFIRPGLETEGELGYWVVEIPEMVWSTEEVRALAEIIPHVDIAEELRDAIARTS